MHCIIVVPYVCWDVEWGECLVVPPEPDSQANPGSLARKLSLHPFIYILSGIG